MAKTIRQSFSEFKSNLEITDRQSEIVSNCRKNLVATFVDSNIDLHDQQARVIGSYDRNTLIRPLSNGDVDLMIILHYGKNKGFETPEGTVKVLDKFKSILDAKYPNTTKRRDRNCITMKLSEFRLDVVPAFSYEGGYYKIPDSIEQTWVSTNPLAFADKITSINKNMDNDFVPLIKMAKAWNKANGDLLTGYHLECLMYHRYKTYSQSYTYDSMLKVFFQELPAYLQNYCYDPIMGGTVDGYLGSYYSDARTKAVNKAKDAEKQSALAQALSENDPKAGIAMWKSLLGTYFPSYG